MKKILALLISAALVLAMTACGLDSDRDSDRGSNRNPKEKVPVVKYTGKKIEGEIAAASVFSEGLAFVRMKNDGETTYCINKEGDIVFQINKKLSTPVQLNDKFINGYMLIDGELYDTSGKATSPEDVGADQFYGIALEGGYLLAERVTATNEYKNELGVMNTNFEWVLQPSEALYNAVEEILGDMDHNGGFAFYCDDVIYFSSCEKYLNIKTGEMTSEADVKIDSSLWRTPVHPCSCYEDPLGNDILDLRNYKDFTVTGCSKFEKGRAPIVVENKDTGREYFTIIDENGNFVFEPQKTKNISNIGLLQFDGETLVIGDLTVGGELESYNVEGEFLGELNTRSVGFDGTTVFKVSDGVVLVFGIRDGMNDFGECYYFNPDFTPLFETENS